MAESDFSGLVPLIRVALVQHP